MKKNTFPRVILTLLLLLTLIVGLMPGRVFAEQATPEHIPRIVSILFDDSGSMESENAGAEQSMRWKHLQRCWVRMTS